MKKSTKKLLCTFLALALLALPMLTLSAGAAIVEGEVTVGSNEELQDYSYANWSWPVRSYLVETAEGLLMRVQANSVGGYYYVEYYDAEYNRVDAFAVEAELPEFGAFYATESNYYVLSGQENPEESPAVECFRVTKYDLEWNKLGDVGMYDCNTTRPFHAGSARMTHSGKYLLIRTCHEMYKSSDGLNHQANVTIQVDTETMQVTDAFYNVMNYGVGYVSHSFNQFIKVDNDHIVAVDHGDAHPRAIALIYYPTLVSSGKFYSWGCEMTEVLSIPEANGFHYNYTGASVGGFEISDRAYLVAYSSIEQDPVDYRGRRDLYVAAVFKDGENMETLRISDGVSNCSTPHLVKIDDDRFLVLWSSGGSVFYMEIDGIADPRSEVYEIPGAALSDCVPIVAGDKVVWYTYQNSSVIFYEISTTDISEGRQIVSYTKGDVNDNGKIDAGDYMMVKRYVLGTYPLNTVQLAASDVNEDGKVNALDYMFIKRHVLGTYVIE